MNLTMQCYSNGGPQSSYIIVPFYCFYRLKVSSASKQMRCSGSFIAALSNILSSKIQLLLNTSDTFTKTLPKTGMQQKSLFLSVIQITLTA